MVTLSTIYGKIKALFSHANEDEKGSTAADPDLRPQSLALPRGGAMRSPETVDAVLTKDELVRLVSASCSNAAIRRYLKEPANPAFGPADAVTLVDSNPAYRGYLEDSAAAVKFLIAKSMVASSRMVDCSRSLPEILSESFAETRKLERYQKYCDQIWVWDKYFVAALCLLDRIPESLIDFALLNLANAHTIIDLLGDYGCRKSLHKGGCAIGEGKVLSWVQEIFEDITAWYPGDIRLVLDCGRAAEKLKDYPTVRNYYRMAFEMGASKGESPNRQGNYLSHVAASYLCQIESMKARGGKDLGHKIKKLAAEGIREHERLIAFAKANGVERPKYLRRMICLLGYAGRIDEAEEAIRQNSSGYRRLLEFGLFYSPAGKHWGSCWTQRADYPRATACFIEAWKAMEGDGESDVNSRMSVLCPLARTLAAMGETQDAYEVASYGLAIRDDPGLRGIAEAAKGRGLSPEGASNRAGLPEILKAA